MILSNVEIRNALNQGRLIITPNPQPSSYDTTAVDLHLASALSIPGTGPFNYDLRRGGIATFLSRNSSHVDIPDAGYVLEPRVFLLGRTVEKVSLPLLTGQSLAARIEGKSSFARCGLLVHFTAPTVHAGFDGTLTLEMINLGSAGISLFTGMPICQLILETVIGDPDPHPSQFQGQTTPAGISRS